MRMCSLATVATTRAFRVTHLKLVTRNILLLTWVQGEVAAMRSRHSFARGEFRTPASNI
jgi:hypothetical protein